MQRLHQSQRTFLSEDRSGMEKVSTILDELAKSGVKKLLVMCPAFVADCIETLEEIGDRGKEQFREAGGEELVLVPCLNDDPQWAKALNTLCERAPLAL